MDLRSWRKKLYFAENTFYFFREQNTHLIDKNDILPVHYNLILQHFIQFLINSKQNNSLDSQFNFLLFRSFLFSTRVQSTKQYEHRGKPTQKIFNRNTISFSRWKAFLWWSTNGTKCYSFDRAIIAKVKCFVF